MRLTRLGLTAVLVTAVALTGCSAGSSPADNCTTALQPGSLTAATEVSGRFGSTPKVTIPDETSTSVSERDVLQSGDEDGRPAQQGDLVSINFVVLDASTGNEIQTTTFSPTKAAAPVMLTEEFSFPGLYKGLLCAQPGDRLLLAIAPKDGLGAEGSAAWGLSEDATLLMVVDVVAVSIPRADGKVKQLPNGFPNIVTNDDGQVGIILPPSTPGTEIRTAVRIQGTGPAVTAENIVFGQVLTVDWNSRQVLASTWQDGSPTSFGAEADGSALRAQLTGYPVGSQVVVIAPGQAGPQVSVVDILGVG